MSTHLSASQRQILALQHRIAELEQMQKEYNAFLNYVVEFEGAYNEELGGKVFVVLASEAKSLKLLPIKSEIIDNGARLVLRRVEPTNNNSIITLPA
jgi:prefoldin subunit 5